MNNDHGAISFYQLPNSVGHGIRLSSLWPVDLRFGKEVLNGT